jgi:hypothetical protein
MIWRSYQIRLLFAFHGSRNRGSHSTPRPERTASGEGSAFRSPQKKREDGVTVVGVAGSIPLCVVWCGGI